MARKHEYERNEAIKKMIIDAALAICLEDGYKEVTVRRIGDKIGYSTGVIYYHFRDKQDIMDSLDKRLDEEAYVAISKIINADSSIAENLSALYDYTCDLAYNNAEVYKRIFVASRVEGNGNTRSMWLSMIKDCLVKAAERGEIASDDIDATSKCVLAYITGYNLLFFEITRTCIETAKADKENAISSILNGILAH